MFAGKYLKAWIADWTAGMSGLASVVLTFWTTFFPPTSYQLKWALIASAIAFFILGSYHIWAKEHGTVLEYQKKFHPQLRATMKVMIGAVDTEFLQGAANITVFLTIRNTGAPSIAENWRLFVDTPLGPIEGTHVVSDVDLTMEMADGRSNILKSKDRIDKKLAEVPIVTGASRHGFLMFAFAGQRIQFINQATNQIRLEFCDIEGTKTVLTEKKLSEPLKLLPGEGLYMPGIDFPPSP